MCEESVRLVNHVKQYFFRLAADTVGEVSSMKDSKGILNARKALVMTGISLGYNNVWQEAELTQDLQEIIGKHRNHFEREPVTTEDILTESESDLK